jgi:hypothetical protein
MGTVSNPINLNPDVSGTSNYTSLHLPVTVLPSAVPQDVALISVQAAQRGESDTLFGHSLAGHPLATLNSTPATPAAPTSAAVPSDASPNSAPATDQGAQSPQQQLGEQQLDSIRALYSSRIQQPPAFSVMA